jgi:hypothetical protein
MGNDFEELHEKWLTRIPAFFKNITDTRKLVRLLENQREYNREKTFSFARLSIPVLRRAFSGAMESDNVEIISGHDFNVHHLEFEKGSGSVVQLDNDAQTTVNAAEAMKDFLNSMSHKKIQIYCIDENWNLLYRIKEE